MDFHAQASVHLDLFDLNGDIQDLESAAKLLRRALQTVSEENKASCEGDLGAALRRIYLRTGEVSTLHEAVGFLRNALQRGTGSFDHFISFVCGLQEQSELDGDITRLDSAVSLMRARLSNGRLDDEARAETLSVLSTALQDRYEAASDEAALRESIELARQAVAITGSGHRRASAYHSHLGLALRMAYENSGDTELLGEAVEESRASVRTAEEGGHSQAVSLVNLSTALRFLYERTGSAPVLEEAIRSVRKAIAQTSDEHHNQASYHSNLSLLLWTRYERLNDLETLVEAISTGREAVARTEPGTVDYNRYSLNLALALWTRHDREPGSSTLNEAIGILRETVANTDTSRTLFPICASNLSNALRARFLHGRAPSDLQEAMDVADRVLRHAGNDHVDQARYTSNIGTLHIDRHRHASAGSTEDLTKATARFREALCATPADHLDHALYSFNLGEALYLYTRHGGSSEIGAETEARRLLRTAAESSRAPASLRVEAAQLAGRMAADDEDWAAAADLWALGVRLLPRVAPRHLGLHDRGHALSRFLGLASDAAAAALQRDDTGLALSLLEQGRGILLSRLLQNDSDLEALRAKNPELASEYEWLRTALDQHGSTDQAPSITGHDDAHLNFIRWESLIEQIRSVPGMERFSLGPTTEQIIGLASGAALVVVNGSRYRCDALIVTNEGLTCQRLPSLDTDTVMRWVSRLQEAVTGVRESHGRRRSLAEKDFTELFGELSSWLWENVVGPVVEGLPDTTRMVWSPTGLLTALPLHAAGRKEPGDLLDRVVSSYTPTLRTLDMPDREQSQRPTPEQLLLVSTADDLSAADRETDTVAQILGTDAPLRGRRALKQPVVDALPRCVVAHLAVHGISEPREPAHSCLALADADLELAEISRMRSERGWLAYLSACDTAAPSEMLSDEALHLAAAFLAAGFAHVIATLWPAEDESAATVAQDFYRMGVPADPAAALNRSLRELRREMPASPFRWGAYQHWGNNR
ncbi:CHAT domain-containing protein [Nocardiopsis dassonvillei]|uniref:CHAT domain-containing protein n=1 Tax=Nocardiopsis dassonvillei TaxID=2014 RepID=UPI0033FEEA1A